MIRDENKVKLSIMNVLRWLCGIFRKKNTIQVNHISRSGAIATDGNSIFTGGHSMNPDFLDAHDRHWKDAETLFNASRWANADHLYGLSAECGLKRLMKAFGMPVNQTGDPDNKKDWAHVNEKNKTSAWDRYETYRAGRGAAKYTLPGNNPFLDWLPSQRYAKQSNFNQARVEPHKQGAKMIQNLLKMASETDGIL